MACSGVLAGPAAVELACVVTIFICLVGSHNGIIVVCGVAQILLWFLLPSLFSLCSKKPCSARDVFRFGWTLYIHIKSELV